MRLQLFISLIAIVRSTSCFSSENAVRGFFGVIRHAALSAGKRRGFGSLKRLPPFFQACTSTGFSTFTPFFDKVAGVHVETIGIVVDLRNPQLKMPPVRRADIGTTWP
jgi:hypothetical protein